MGADLGNLYGMNNLESSRGFVTSLFFEFMSLLFRSPLEIRRYERTSN